MNAKAPEQNEFESSLNLLTFMEILLAIMAGILAAIILLPAWIPSLAGSLTGANPKGFWYLSRGSAFVAMSLLWVSMALGLGISNKMARFWPGAPAAFAIHEYVSLLGLVFAVFHALVLLGDQYIKFTLVQILVPFAATGYKPFWVGLGQTGLYVWLMVTVSFYVRSKIGPKTWRLLHYLSFLSYAVALYHGISSGTDTTAVWAQLYYWISGGSLLFLLFYRISMSISNKLAKSAARQAPAAAARR